MGGVIAANFYAEDLGISVEHAERVASFTEQFTGTPAIGSIKPWAAGDMVRVYVEIRSQNSLQPIKTYDKLFYDARENEAYLSGCAYGKTERRPLRDCLKWKSGMFSGAKTRQWVQEFAEEFYAKKANWD
jgi:hypothetical protein